MDGLFGLYILRYYMGFKTMRSILLFTVGKLSEGIKSWQLLLLLQVKERLIMDFDINRLQRLKVAYSEAQDRHLPNFNFEGQDFVTGFAKYVIEYLEAKFNG